jgi:hypothetical protein
MCWYVDTVPGTAHDSVHWHAHMFYADTCWHATGKYWHAMFADVL